MNRRRPTSGRPSGTDGSDYSYRMVVDSRYQKVAKGKSRLAALFLTQAIIQLTVVVYLFLATSKKWPPDNLALSFAAISLITLFIGESGRSRSRASFLKIYMVGSTVALLLLLTSVFKNNFVLEVIRDLGNWEIKKVEILGIACILLGVLFHIFILSTTISLIGNMSPPKRAS